MCFLYLKLGLPKPTMGSAGQGDIQHCGDVKLIFLLHAAIFTLSHTGITIPSLMSILRTVC